jgi:hypothetical protein
MAIADIFLNLGKAFVDIIKPMFIDFSLFWYLGPILLFWLILEIYFSRYKTEELGWNTALGNGLSVFWIITICMKYLFDNHLENFHWGKFAALITMLLYAVFIIVNSFSHKLRDKVSFLLASPTATYYLSGVAVLWTYGKLQITVWVLIALVLFYGFVLLVELILKKIIKAKETGGFGTDSLKSNQDNLGGLGGF